MKSAKKFKNVQKNKKSAKKMQKIATSIPKSAPFPPRKCRVVPKSAKMIIRSAKQCQEVSKEQKIVKKCLTVVPFLRKSVSVPDPGLSRADNFDTEIFFDSKIFVGIFKDQYLHFDVEKMY